MISKTIQNEIISTVREVLCNKVVSKIRDAKFFSILADETANISMTDQMIMCIRYIDKLEVEDKLQYILCEDFIGWIHRCSCHYRKTGKNLKNVLVQELINAELSLSNLCGQDYGGHSNMSGNGNGVQCLLLKNQSLAFCTHCFSHSSSLCAAKVCDIVAVPNMLNTVCGCPFYSNNGWHSCIHLLVSEWKCQESFSIEKNNF